MSNSKDKDKDLVKGIVKDKPKSIIKGYMSYNLIKNLGSLDNLIDYKKLKRRITKFVKSLESNLSYNIIPVVSWFDEDALNNKGVSICKSFKVTRDINIDNLTTFLLHQINESTSKYGMDIENSQLQIMYKVWLSDIDFKLSFKDVGSIINKDLLRLMPSNKLDGNFILNRVDVNNQGEFANLLMDNYGEVISKDDILEKYLTGFNYSDRDLSTYRNNNFKYYVFNKDILLKVATFYKLRSPSEFYLAALPAPAPVPAPAHAGVEDGSNFSWQGEALGRATTEM